jgi:hypothetical protein
MQSWWRNAWGDLDVQRRKHPMEGLADRTWINESIPAKGEDGGLGSKRSPSPLAQVNIGSESLRHVRPERHQSALGELRLANDEKSSIEIDVPETELAGLTYSEPQSIEHCEDGPVRNPSIRRLGIIGQARRHIQQLSHLIQVEEKGQSLRRLAPRLQRERRVPQNLLLDHPVEEPSEYSQQVVVAARGTSRPRGHECLQKRGRYVGDGCDVLLVQKPIQKTQ